MKLILKTSMEKGLVNKLIVLIGLIFYVQLSAALHLPVKYVSESSQRERISINEGWSFFKYESAAKADKLIYDVRPEIREMAGKEYAKGKHSVEFDKKNLVKGIYIYTIKADKFSASQKMSIQGE